MKSEKERKYSVFLGNAGHCFDRYCPQYSSPFSIEELFQRVATIDLIRGVELVAAPDLMKNIPEVKDCLKKYGLKAVSIAADTFTQAQWKQGSLSSIDPVVRAAAMEHVEETIALCHEVNCDMLTFWLGQDGYDYLFQSDYIAERENLIQSLKTICQKHPDITVALEYKCKEPRNHCYINSAASALLFCSAVGEENCKVIIDYGHALIGYENPAESVSLLKQFGDKLCHIHINDNYRLWDDDMIVGSVHTLEYLEFFYWLRTTSYTGWMTIDQFPYREDGQMAVAESAEWLNWLETLIDNADFGEIQDVLKKKDAVESSRLMRKILQSGRG